MKTYIFLTGGPILRRKIRINGEFNIIPNGKRLKKKNSPPRDTGIPLRHDYIFIKEVDTPNGISYHGGNDVVHDFCTWGTGDEGDTVLKCYSLELFTLSINIH